MYPDALFYKTHKISTSDFIQKVEQSAEPLKLIDELFDDESHGTGRRGVMSVRKSVAVVQKKMRNKDRLLNFARKFSDEGLTKSELKSTGFMRSDMLY